MAISETAAPSKQSTRAIARLSNAFPAGWPLPGVACERSLDWLFGLLRPEADRMTGSALGHGGRAQ